MAMLNGWTDEESLTNEADEESLTNEAIESERARCLRLVEECCVAFRNSARDDMAEARE